MKKERSRLLILHHIAQFSLGRRFPDGSPWPTSEDWCFRPTDDPTPGSLVALQSAPLSKWYISWFIEKSHPKGWIADKYTLESIEDGQLCDWNNVSFLQFNKKTTDEHPEWRWTDEQHEFNDRWKRACFKKRNAYIYLPCIANFIGEQVELGVRMRWGLGEAPPTKIFPNWRKCRIKDMLEFYDASTADSKRSKKVSA